MTTSTRLIRHVCSYRHAEKEEGVEEVEEEGEDENEEEEDIQCRSSAGSQYTPCLDFHEVVSRDGARVGYLERAGEDAATHNRDNGRRNAAGQRIAGAQKVHRERGGGGKLVTE